MTKTAILCLVTMTTLSCRQDADDAFGAVQDVTTEALRDDRLNIQWRACDDAELSAAGAQCATLTVALDHGDGRRSGQVQLALSRIRHTSSEADFQGAMLTVPDYLSGSGYKLPLLSARVPNAAGASYDWIGFAPRGLAPSAPALQCNTEHFALNRPPYKPQGLVDEAYWLERAQAYADGCEAAQPELLEHMRTTDSVEDMEALRRALGVNRLSLFAQSYGTYLAQAYASRYPRRLHRVVMDSTVDPRRVWYRANSLDQDAQLDRNLLGFFGWLAAHHDAFQLGSSAEAVRLQWDRTLAELTAQPADGQIGPSEWTDVFLFAAYSQQIWPLLAGMFSGYVQTHDITPVKQFFIGSYQGHDNTYSSLLARICTDAPYPTDWSTWRQDATSMEQRAPYSTWGNTWFNAPCFYWSARPSRALEIDGTAVSSALLVGQELDAAAPFEGSLEVRARFPNARLLAVSSGMNHASALTGHDCVDAKVASYLLSGTLPARRRGRQADDSCPAPALPIVPQP